MTFTAKIAALAGSFLFAGAISAATPNLPACPDAGAIKAQGLSMAEQLLPGMYIAYDVGQYNTEGFWFFGIGPVEAEDENAALVSGNKSLTTLSGQPTAEQDEDGNIYCAYSLSDANMQAYAVEISGSLSKARFRHYFHK
ncbi:DUF4949 domain-containing protein [Legionella spiritensis]|uniref:Hemin binding protein n=1 Tax=Legionella spiritensis TaxID=452 RepID=A0A0W0YWF2_LEGSP|nr:DUF4949 domain-containing protein [Legionella spiritensis]KTD61253.1 hemin binding protein [Legionella spiritensis]SNV23581.1 hemin binding protein Hbp [Legionella spiritensis]